MCVLTDIGFTYSAHAIVMKKSIVFSLLVSVLLTCPDMFSQMPGRKVGASKSRVTMPAFTMNFNLLNAALYGPIIQAEIKLDGTSFLVPWVRYSYAGLASHWEWTNFEDDSEFYPTGIGVGAGYKAFLPINRKGRFIYYGGFGEFIYEKGLRNMGTEYEYVQTRLAAAVYGNLGYRWSFKRSFYLNLGILPGFAFDIKNEGLYNTGASEGLLYDDYKKNRFIGMIDFSFGWNLRR